MFTLSMVFLFGQAVLVVLWADVPLRIETALREKDADVAKEKLEQTLELTLDAPLMQADFQSVMLVVMLAIWPIFIFESVFHWFTRTWGPEMRRHHFYGLLICVCPSLRMCARSPELADRIWLPGLGWRRANKYLRSRLQRYFSVPMIMIALLIMPVLIIEFFLKDQVAQNAWLRWPLDISTGVIWFAFAGEFILMFSVAEKKIDYCKKHWVDLAIILLPFISFLRSLRVLRATRAANLLRVSQISKFARVYRLRGTAIKALRALILLELFQRLAGGPEGSIKRMKKRLVDLDAESRELRRKIARLQRTMNEKDGVDSMDDFDDTETSPERETQVEPQSVAESSLT